MRREQILYSLMLIGAASWVAALVMMAEFLGPDIGPEWIIWIEMLFVAFAILAIIATLILSIFIAFTGPETARFAVLKWLLWLLLFVPSVVLVSHLVPLWVPILFSLVLSLLPVKWLVASRVKVNSNVAA
jgi:hypothetical protein